MSERFDTFMRYTYTLCALGFGLAACELGDGWRFLIALAFWILCTIRALELWCDRIVRSIRGNGSGRGGRQDGSGRNDRDDMDDWGGV